MAKLSEKDGVDSELERKGEENKAMWAFLPVHDTGKTSTSEAPISRQSLGCQHEYRYTTC